MLISPEWDAVFAHRVRVEETGCWIWTGGSRRAGGYGTVRYKGPTHPAHRLSFVLATGACLKPHSPKTGVMGDLVCHKCDVRLCCNPAHLFVGSHLDNMRDMQAKGRDNYGCGTPPVFTGDEHWARRMPERVGRGEEIGNSVLKESDVRDIRNRVAAGEEPRRVAADYGVYPSTIHRCVNRRTWRHVE